MLTFKVIQVLKSLISIVSEKQEQWCITAHMHFPAVSVGEESGHLLIGSFFGSHKTAIKVSIRTGIPSDVRLEMIHF